MDKGDFVFRMAQLENKATDLSTSSLLEIERQRLVGEKEWLERERRELEQLKSLVRQRQALEVERTSLVSQKDQLESKSLETFKKQSYEDQLKKSVEERKKVEQTLQEVEELKIKLANLAGLSTKRINEIGRDENFIAYDDGTVLDTKTNLMWWSKDIEVHDWENANYKSRIFRGGGYSDWRLPSIIELETIYIKNSNRLFRTIGFIDLSGPEIYSKDIGDEITRTTFLYFDFRDGTEGYTAWSTIGGVGLLPVRLAN